jgi:hypothetical protein
MSASTLNSKGDKPMFKLTVFLKKALLVALIAGIGLAALPAGPALAASAQDEGNPPQEQLSDERLAEIWAREVASYERIGTLLDRVDSMIAKAEEFIARANERGIDTSVVQAALDAFATAVQGARPIYQSANGIVQSHQGFDAGGQVTDRARAIETVRELGAKLRDVKAAMAGTGQALRAAMRALREANRPSETPVP